MAPSEPASADGKEDSAGSPGRDADPLLPSLRAAVARVTCDGGVRGTAFLIDPQHALTALHVVADRQGRPPALYTGVQLDFSGHLTAASVVPGAYDVDADWALVRLQTPPRDAAGRLVPPLPLDDLGEEELHLAEQAGRALGFRSRGFPDANPDYGLEVGGEVRTTLGQVGGVRALQLFSHEAAAGTGAPVSGLSGAPVWVAGAVVGLLRTAILDGEGRAIAGALFACPASTVLAALRSSGRPPLQLAQTACPYPGMVAFGRHQSALFFGRSAEIDWLLMHLRKQRFALVLGPSGSGKSSLIYAGLLPRLPANLIARTLRPGDQPDQELSAQLGGEGDPLLATLGAEQRLVLFIDQLEELFARCPRPVQQRFVNRLQTLRSDPRCILLLALRADFFPDLMNSELWPVDPAQRLEVAPLRGAALATAIAGPAAQAGVRLEPTLLERLVADAADEPGALPLLQEALVLLWERREHRRLTLAAYEELGRQRIGSGGASSDGRTLSGLGVAIASHAEAVFTQMPAEQQALARRIFVRLVHFGEGRPNTRRQLPLAALRAQGDSPAALTATLERLTSQRLLTESLDETAPAAADPEAVRIDLSHEVILRAWPRLLRWLGEKKQAERIRRRLEDQASERIRLRHQGYGLLDGAETKEAEDWLQGPDAKDVGVSTAVAELIYESRRALRFEAAHAQRVARRWQALALAMLGLAILAAVAMRMALSSSTQAQLEAQEADVARHRADDNALAATAHLLSSLSREQLGLDSGDDQALLYAVGGQRLQPSADSESSLLNALDQTTGLRKQLHGLRGQVNSVAVAPDGHVLAAGCGDGRVWLFDPRSGQGQALVGHHGAVNQVAFNVEGTRLFSAGDDGTLRVWDSRAAPNGQGVGQGIGQFIGQLIGQPLTGHTGAITALAVSPDRKLIATGGGDDMTIFLWDAVTGLMVGPPLTGHKKTVSGLAFSSDGHKLASVSWDQTVRLWAPRSGQALPLTLPRSSYTLRAVAFSPTAALLAVGGGDGRAASGSDSPATGVQLWSLESPQPAAKPLDGSPKSIVLSLAFSPDGHELAAGTWDKRVALWNVASGKASGKLRSPGGRALALTYAPDGDWLATATEDSGLFLWSPHAAPTLLRSTASVAAELTSIASSPDGKLLAAGSQDQALHLFAVDDAGVHATTVLTGTTGIVYSVAFSADGKLLAAAGEDHLVRLWDPSSGKPHGEPLAGHADRVYRVAFDPSGTRLASGGWDGELRLWSPTDGKPIATPQRGHTQAIQGLGWSADGTRLCSASGDKSLRIWDGRTGAPLGQLDDAHDQALTSCAFTPKSPYVKAEYVVTASEDGTLRVWKLVPAATADGRLRIEPVGAALRGHKKSVSQLVIADYGPRGQRILSVSKDQTLRLWDLQLQQFIGTLALAPRGLSGVALLPGAHRAVTVGDDRTVRLWDLTPGAWVRTACQRAGRNLSPSEYTRTGLENLPLPVQKQLEPLCSAAELTAP